MNLLNRIWPWSKIRRLEDHLRTERDFGNACLYYLNDRTDSEGKQLGVRFVRFGAKLHFVDADAIYEVDYVSNPRMNMRVEGIK